MHIGTKLERNYRERPETRDAFGEEDPLTVIKDLGLEFVEWPLSPEFDEEEAWKLVRACWDHGLRADLHPYLAGEWDTANFEEVEGNACAILLHRYLSFAHRVGVEQGHPCVVNLHPPTSLFAKADIPASHLRRILVLRSLYCQRWIESMLQRNEWNVVVTAEVQYAAEPEEGFVRLGDHYREVLFCISGVERVGACWDMGHSTINHTRFGTEMYPMNPPEEFVRRVRHVHLHNVRGREDHFPLSEGVVPYGEHLARLKAAGYEGDINLELPLRKIIGDGPYCEVMSDCIRRVHDAWR